MNSGIVYWTVLDGKEDHTEKAYEVFLEKYSYSANKQIFENMIDELYPEIGAK